MLLLFACCMALHAYADEEKNISYRYPDIPLLEILTENEEWPPFTLMDHPTGLMGNTVVNNKYVRGNLRLWKDHKLVYSTGDFNSGSYGMKLKIRGNSSAYYSNHKPYKIKLSRKADLFHPDDPQQKDDEFVLLQIATWNTTFDPPAQDVSSVIGACVSRFLGAEWTPRFEYVNVIVNHEYRGCYLLADPVTRDEGRVKTDPSGFIIENDAYWWKPSMIYFKTQGQNVTMGYTFKYPDDEDITYDFLDLCKECVETAEHHLFSVEEVEQYIDYPSFARWVLIHDILGTSDAAGSNMFLYKESLDPDDLFATPLKMGPTWDYDTIFMMEDDQYSNIHTLPLFYYPQLFTKVEFIDEYVRQWQSVKDGIADEVKRCLDDLLAQGEPLESSLKLSHGIYWQQVVDLKTQCDVMYEKLQRRLTALDRNIKALAGGYSIPVTPQSIPVTPLSDPGATQSTTGATYDLSGRRVTTCQPEGLYIRNGRVVLHR